MTLSERVLTRSFTGTPSGSNTSHSALPGWRASGVTFLEPGAEAYAFTFE